MFLRAGERRSERSWFPGNDKHHSAVARALCRPTFDCCMVRFDIFKQPVSVHLGRENSFNSVKSSDKVSAASLNLLLLLIPLTTNNDWIAALLALSHTADPKNHFRRISFGWRDVCGEVKVNHSVNFLPVSLQVFYFKGKSVHAESLRAECATQWAKGRWYSKRHCKTNLHTKQSFMFCTFILQLRQLDVLSVGTGEKRSADVPAACWASESRAQTARPWFPWFYPVSEGPGGTCSEHIRAAVSMKVYVAVPAAGLRGASRDLDPSTI